MSLLVAQNILSEPFNNQVEGFADDVDSLRQLKPEKMVLAPVQVNYRYTINLFIFSFYLVGRSCMISDYPVQF